MTGLALLQILQVAAARRVWDYIMASTYDFAEPWLRVDRSGQ
jgi:hypothetical protein